MKFETLAIHAGQEPDPNNGAVMTPDPGTLTRHAIDHERDVRQHDDPNARGQRLRCGRFRSAEGGFHARNTSIIQTGRPGRYLIGPK